MSEHPPEVDPAKVSAAPPEAPPVVSRTTAGLIALCIAVVCFSLASTVVKKATLPGPTLAFWRMLATSAVWWVILWVTQHRIISWADIRRTLVPGVVFGINLVCFFTGVTKTTVANAEFVASLTPLVVVPAGAIFFKEHINRKALWFGLLSLVGLMLVLFNAPPRGEASWAGNSIVFGAVVLWAIYLLTSRRLRNEMSIQAIMAAVMTIATVTILPITLLPGARRCDRSLAALHRHPDADDGRTCPRVDRVRPTTVPVGTHLHPAGRPTGAGRRLGLPAAEPSIRPIQMGGMVLVIVGLLAVVLVTRRMAGRATETLEPVGPAAICD